MKKILYIVGLSLLCLTACQQSELTDEQKNNTEIKDKNITIIDQQKENQSDSSETNTETNLEPTKKNLGKTEEKIENNVPPTKESPTQNTEKNHEKIGSTQPTKTPSATSLSSVEASYVVFEEYFVKKKHFEQSIIKDSHNGYGFEQVCENTPASSGPGFFRSGTDIVFLVELYHQLAKNNDPRKETVYTVAINALKDFTRQLNLAKPCSKSWINGMSSTPDEGWILMALSTAYGKLPLESPLKEKVRTQVDLAAKSVVLAYKKLDRVYGPSMFNHPKKHYCGKNEEYSTEISNNLYGIYAGALSEYAQYVWLKENRNQSFPYTDTWKHIITYIVNSQGEQNGFWKVGGNRSESCDMAIHYNTWNILGLSLAIEGLKKTNQEPAFINKVERSVLKGTDSLKTLHQMHGYFPERASFDYQIVVANKTPAFAFPVTYANDQTLLNNIISDLGGYLHAASDETNGKTGESNFHRLLSGLTGAMKHHLTIEK